MANEQGSKPRHKATYARDKKKGGWLIRISGEYPHKFAGREVPVTMMSGELHTEKLEKLIWQGTDDKTGELVALYSFVAQPKEPEPEPVF